MNTGNDPIKALHGKELLIFDFDGTVADTTPLHAAAFSQVLAPLGVTVDYSAIAGLKTLDAIRRCVSGHGAHLNEAQLKELVVAKQTAVRQMIPAGLKPIAGVDSFLDWARPRYRLAMVTSGSRGSVNLALETLGYTGWFDPLICAEDVRCGKPSPEGFAQALSQTDTHASKALIFEDSQAGFEAARAAGVEYIDICRYSWNWLLSSCAGAKTFGVPND